MKVILKDNIEYLGKKGDIVKVAPGYGRNYLLPKKLALEVTATNMKMIEMVQKSLRKGLEKEMKVYQSLIEKLNAVTLTFFRKSGEKDTIFGSVSVTDIRDALAELKFEVEKKRILLDEPIKRLGNYTVPIKVFHDDRAEIKLEVAREGGPDEEVPTAPEAIEIPIAPETEPEPVPTAVLVDAETEGVTDSAPAAEEPEAAPEIPEEPAVPAETKPEESAPETPEEKAEEEAPASPDTETEPAAEVSEPETEESEKTEEIPAAEAQEPGPESTEPESEPAEPAAESQEPEADMPEPEAESPEPEKTEGIPTEEPSPEPQEKEETPTEEPPAEPEVPKENSKDTDKKP